MDSDILYSGILGSFTLHWLARAGEHSYTVELYSVNKGQKSEEDEKRGSVSVSRVVNGLSAWLEVEPSVVKAGDNVTVFITVENLEDYKQTWPIQIVDSAGNVRWPHERYWGLNYSISNGQLTIYARKTARIMATIGPITQNTTLTLKIGGIPMAWAYVEVRSAPGLVMDSVSCGDLFLQVDGTLDYKGTATCRVGFRNPTQNTASIDLSKSDVISVDFPMDHSNGAIDGKSSTIIYPKSTGNIYIKFTAWTTDFTAFARYWVYGYYSMPVTIKFRLGTLIGNKFTTKTYIVSSDVTVKTSNTVYVVVPADVASFAASGEALKGVIIAAKAGKRAKTAWEIFKIAQGFIRGILKKW